MAERKIAISYCTTCKGRLYQLRETLADNLAALSDDEEIVLADYHSPDGLSDWIWDTHRDAIAARRLRFFEVLDEAPWHMAKAKNLAHRVARGTYLFNLDGDNFIRPEDTRQIRAAMAEGLCCRQGSGDLTDGTPGRIGMPRAVFYELGGYDEGLLSVVLDDYDMIVRIEAAGYRFARLGPPMRAPIQNDRQERLAQYVVAKTPEDGDVDRLLQINLAVHRARLELQGPHRRQNFATFHGRLNGVEVILDGLGNLHRVQRNKET